MSIAGAAGVHLPADAASVRIVKAQAEDNLCVGCSVHSLNAAEKRETEGADFVTYSPIYPTASKPGYGPAVGVEGLAKVVENVRLPVFALGGRYTCTGYGMFSCGGFRCRCNVRRYGFHKRMQKTGETLSDTLRIKHAYILKT